MSCRLWDVKASFLLKGVTVCCTCNAHISKDAGSITHITGLQPAPAGCQSLNITKLLDSEHTGG